MRLTSFHSHLSSILPVALLALIASWSFSAAAAEAKASKATMEVLARKYDDAFNRRDAAALASLYHQEAQIVPPDGPVVQGRAAVEAFWKSELATTGFVQSSKVVEVQDFGEVALEHGEWVGKSPGGATVEVGKYLMAWKRSGGEWRIFRETWNNSREVANSSEAQEELRRASADYDAAWLNQDATALNRLLADDYVQINPDGKIRTKAVVLKDAKSGDIKLEIGRSEDLKSKIYGEIAITTGRWVEKGTEKGTPFGGTLQNSVVYQRISGHWKVIGDQSTTIKADAP